MNILKNNLVKNLRLHLKRDLKNEKTKTVEYIKDCFGKKLDNMDLYLGHPKNWDTSQTVWKHYWKRRLIISEGHSIQELLRSNGSRWSIFRNVRFCSSIDSSQMKILWRKEYTSKTVLRSFITDFGRKIYSDNLRALHRKFYATQTENVSFSVFYTYYVSKPY